MIKVVSRPNREHSVGYMTACSIVIEALEKRAESLFAMSKAHSSKQEDLDAGMTFIRAQECRDLAGAFQGSDLALAMEWGVEVLVEEAPASEPSQP